MMPPPFETPDEVYHYAFARHMAQGNGLPVQTAAGSGPWEQEGSQAPLYYATVGLLTAGIDQGDFAALAVRNPQIIAEGAKAFGAQCIVLGMDPVRTDDLAKCPSGYEITTRGFRERTGMDALAWARRAEELGAGEIVVNSVDADGTREGFELNLTRMISTSAINGTERMARAPPNPPLVIPYNSTAGTPVR